MNYSKTVLLTILSLALGACGETETPKTMLLVGGTGTDKLLVETDTDNDGMSDSIDPFPERAPESGEWPRPVVKPIEATAIDSQLIHAGGDSVVFISNVDPSAAPYFAWLQSEEGDSVVELDVIDPHRLRLNAADSQFPVQSISVFNASQISPARTVQWADEIAPLVTGVSPPQLGQPWTMRGKNLLDSSVEVSGQLLPIDTRSANELVVHLPSTLLGGDVQLYQDGELQQQFTVRPRRLISVQSGDALSAFEQLHLYSTGEELLLETAPITVKRDAGTQLVVVSLPEAETITAPVAAVAWPDESSVTLDLETMLEAIAYRLKGAWTRQWPDAFQQQRQMLNQLLEQPAAEEARAHLQRALSLESDYNYEYVRQQLIAAASGLSSPAEAKVSAKSTPITDFGRELYEHSISHTIDGDDLTPGRVFKSKISVSVADSLACFALIPPPKPVGLTSADLCVENASIFFLSAQVKIRQDDGSMKLVRKHIPVVPNPAALADVTEYSLLTGFDKDVIGAAGTLTTVSFLSDSANSGPLCGMRYCEVELLIGSLDQFRKVPLSDEGGEKQIVEALLARKLVETFVIPLIVTLSDQLGADLNKQCTAAIFTTLVRNSTTINDLRQKIDANSTRSEIISELTETIGKLAVDIIADKGNTSQNTLLSCMPGGNVEARKAFAFALRQKVSAKVDGTFAGRAPSSGGLGTAIKLVYDSIVLVDALFNTAEKVTFHVTPLVEVKSKSDSFKQPDPNAPDELNGIFLSGDYLANGEGNGRDEFFPELVLTDGEGTSVTIQSEERHFSRPESGEQHKVSALSFLEADLIAAGVDSLAPGDLALELALDGYDDDDFPDGKLRTPAGNISFDPGSRLLSITPSIFFQEASDRRFILRGNRLDKFDYSDFSKVNVVFTDSNNKRHLAPLVVARDFPNDQSNSGGNFLVGALIPTSVVQNAYKVSIEHSVTGATIAGLDRFVVTSSDNLVLTWGDTGRDGQDDDMELTILEPGGTAVSGLPVDEVSGVINQSSFAVKNSEQHKLQFKCVDPGRNGVCTYGYRIEKPTNMKKFVSGKLKKDQCHVHTVNKPEANPSVVGSC